MPEQKENRLIHTPIPEDSAYIIGTTEDGGFAYSREKLCSSYRQPISFRALQTLMRSKHF